jgi:hypothetical protein
MLTRSCQLSLVAVLGVAVVPAVAEAAPPEAESKAAEAGDDAAAAAPDTSADPTTAPEASEPTPEPAPAAPAPPTLDQSTVWNGLVGQQLSLELTGDVTLVGKLMGQQAGQLVLARLGDGAVVGVPYEDVKSVHVRVDRKRARRPIDPKMSNYAGMLAGGGVLLGIGIPAVAAGAVFMWIAPGLNIFMNIHLLGGGGAMVAGGSAMLAVGVTRKKLWTQSMRGYSRASAGGFGGIAHPTMPWSYSLRF